MNFRFEEMPDSRSGASKPPTEKRKYYASGSDDREYVEAYAWSATPAALITLNGTIYRQNIDFDWQSSHYCVCSVDYAQGSKETGSLKWNFDTTGGTIKIKASLSTVNSYPPGVEQHGGAIGVNSSNEVEGCDIVIPAAKMTVAFSHPAGVITLSQFKSLARATGTVAQGTFMSFAEGEVLFLGATGSDGTDSAAEIAYQFACSENLQDQIIGGITVGAKKGWDYSWVQFENDVDSGNPVKKIKAIHVEQVYRRTNLTALLGFG